MTIRPLVLFLIALGITALAAALNRLLVRRRRRLLGKLARDAHMHYSARDVFGLAARVAGRLPIMGAAEVRICDLIYGSDQQALRYVFSAEYTVGVVHSKARRRCVIRVLEPKSGDLHWKSFEVAPENLPLIEQYQLLLKANVQ
jgi:hypothetical protein